MLSKSENDCSSINDFIVIQSLILEPINDITCQVFRAKRIIDQQLYRMYSYYLKDYWGNALTNPETKSLLSILNKIIPISKKFSSNILEFKDFFIDPKVNKLILITEYTNNNTHELVCPEVAHNKDYTCKSDIWYLGLLIYEICCLNKMKRTSIENLNEMYGHIIKGNYKPIPNHYSKNISELIKM